MFGVGDVILKSGAIGISFGDLAIEAGVVIRSEGDAEAVFAHSQDGGLLNHGRIIMAGSGYMNLHSLTNFGQIEVFSGSIGIPSLAANSFALTSTSRLIIHKKVTAPSEAVLNVLGEMARKEWGIYALNPVRDVKMPANGKARDRQLRANPSEAECEESRLIAACKKARNPYLLPFVELALETAMRRSELLNPKWRFIDLTRRTAFFPVTKNGEARAVPLSNSAVETLKTLHKEEEGTVFGRLTRKALKRAFMRATQRVGLDDLHFHDLRHGATTRFFERGTQYLGSCQHHWA